MVVSAPSTGELLLPLENRHKRQGRSILTPGGGVPVNDAVSARRNRPACRKIPHLAQMPPPSHTGPKRGRFRRVDCELEMPGTAQLPRSPLPWSADREVTMYAPVDVVVPLGFLSGLVTSAFLLLQPSGSDLEYDDTCWALAVLLPYWVLLGPALPLGYVRIPLLEC
eukprot:1195641-Prorocentrum_minimum.AAC.3